MHVDSRDNAHPCHVIFCCGLQESSFHEHLCKAHAWIGAASSQSHPRLSNKSQPLELLRPRNVNCEVQEQRTQAFAFKSNSDVLKIAFSPCV